MEDYNFSLLQQASELKNIHHKTINFYIILEIRIYCTVGLNLFFGANILDGLDAYCSVQYTRHCFIFCSWGPGTVGPVPGILTKTTYSMIKFVFLHIFIDVF